MAKYLFFPLFFCFSAMANSWQLQYGFEYFSTDKNFNDQGKSTDLNLSNQYEAYFQNFQLIYRYSRALRFHAGMDLDYGRSQDAVDERTNFRLTNIQLGSEYRFITKYGRFTGGLEANVSTYNFENDTDEVILAEGSNEVYAYFSYSKSFAHRIGLYFESGYLSRDGGRSNLAKYKGEIQLITMPLILAAGVESFVSVTDDDWVNAPATKNNVTNRVNAGSYHFYSVNPSRMDLLFWASYNFTPSFSVQAGYKQAVSGESTSEGQSFFTNIYYSWGAVGYSNEALGFNGFHQGDDGNFTIVPDEYIEEDYFKDIEDEIEEQERKERKERKRKKKKRKRKKSIMDEF
jgi:hypothetical protein